MNETIFTQPAVFPQATLNTYTPSPIYVEQQSNCWHQEDYHNGYPNTCNPYWHVAGRCCQHGCRLCYDKPWNTVPLNDGTFILALFLTVYALFKYFKRQSHETKT